MQFSNVAIESIAYHLPEERWSSSFIEEQLAPIYERLKLPYGRLELMTGIQERRFFSADCKPSTIAAAAGTAIFKKTQFQKNEIDLLVHAAVCRDRLEPCTAAYVHHLLQLPNNTQILDVSNACLGVLNAIVLAASMIEAGHIRTALVVAGENGRPLIEKTIQSLLHPSVNRQSIKPYFANLTIGSGGVAVMLAHTSSIKKPYLQLMAAAVETDSSAHYLCQGDQSATGSLEMQTDSEQLLTVGLEVASRAWEKFKTISQWNLETIQTLICHQVGKRHQTQLYEKLKLNPEKDFSTYAYLGNMGSVALPLTLAKALEEKRVPADSRLSLLGIGSGLSAMIMGLEYKHPFSNL